MNLFAKQARLENGWASDVRVSVAEGRITQIEKGVVAQAGDITVDTLLPSLANLHSHSFQRAMAGRTEFRMQGRESFWTWRDLMYRFLDHLTPDHIAAIAAQTFMEMQLSGYASVGEFHYVHHQRGGAAYDNLAELSLRIMEAAHTSGIGLTHLPVLYTYGGAGGQPLQGGQQRFGNSVDQFANLLSACQKAAGDLPHDTYVGIAPHSLRATLPDDLARALPLAGDGPVHIHVAEQTKEIEEIEAQLGARPVAWLLDNAPVDHRWCLIHATHLTSDETMRMAKSGAVAGLCPITEANLGDGIFNGAEYFAHGGSFGVGSDSNINISLTEELRTLEYSQRLRDRQRNVLAEEGGHTGERLYLGAAKGGAKALNRQAGEIATGALADLVAIDSNDPTLLGLEPAQLLDGLVFAAKDHVVTDLWSAGRHMVVDGHHVAQEMITANYRSAMKDLITRLG